MNGGAIKAQQPWYLERRTPNMSCEAQRVEYCPLTRHAKWNTDKISNLDAAVILIRIQRGRKETVSRERRMRQATHSDTWRMMTHGKSQSEAYRMGGAGFQPIGCRPHEKHSSERGGTAARGVRLPFASDRSQVFDSRRTKQEDQVALCHRICCEETHQDCATKGCQGLFGAPFLPSKALWWHMSNAVLVGHLDLIDSTLFSSRVVQAAAASAAAGRPRPTPNHAFRACYP